MNDNAQTAERLWVNANVATMSGNVPYGAIRSAAVAVAGDRIIWVGPQSELPRRLNGHDPVVCDVKGQWITPGLIDCHTHLVYGGSRAHEFERRLMGASYEEIAREGGGIRATVEHTRQADSASLLAQSLPRLKTLLAEGVTTVEIKSGYGLDLETELRMLEVAQAMDRALPVNVAPTYLGAHALPPEFDHRPDDYIEFICAEVLPVVVEKKLASAVDAYCETIGFSLEQTERVFQAAQHHGLAIKLHAEQFSDQNGARLASEYGALSADHLEYLSDAGCRALARSGTVAVLLPGAFYFLGETQLPPIEHLRRLNVPMAVATDCNPGTSPVGSLLAMLNMACNLFGLTPEEALAGATCHAARALGLAADVGCILPGMKADMAVWSIAEPAELAYGLGYNPCTQIVYHGTPVKQPSSPWMAEDID